MLVVRYRTDEMHGTVQYDFITVRQLAIIGDRETLLCSRLRAWGSQMPYVKDELDVLTAKAAEYKLTADLATDSLKRQQYEWLATEMRDLVQRAEVLRIKLPVSAVVNSHARTKK